MLFSHSQDKRKNIEAVENYLLNDEKVTDTVRISITLQMQEVCKHINVIITHSTTSHLIEFEYVVCNPVII